MKSALGTIEHILVPVDFGDCSRRALQLALEWAKVYGARLTLLHAWLVPEQVSAAVAVSIAQHPESIAELAHREAELNLAKLIRETGAEAGVTLRKEIVRGVPEEQILERAKAHDLVVMGTHGRRGLAHFALGSVAERVLRSSPCPVLVVNAAHLPEP